MHYIKCMTDERTGARKVQLRFYRTAGGAEPVREWLKNLARADRLEIGMDLLRAQYRWPVGMPLCRPLGDGLWEVRTSLPSRTIARVLLCMHDQQLVAVHSFIKKTQKTPDDDLRIARLRKKEVENG
jgi:phage-related protein